MTFHHKKFSEGCCNYQCELYFFVRACRGVIYCKICPNIILLSPSFLADNFDPFTMASSSENQALSGPDLFGDFLNPSSTSTASTVPSTHSSLPPSSSSDILNLGKCASGVLFSIVSAALCHWSFSLVKVD